MPERKCPNFASKRCGFHGAKPEAGGSLRHGIKRPQKFRLHPFFAAKSGQSQPCFIARARSGLSTNSAKATTMKFISAVATNTMCQEPVDDLMRLATGIRKADVPFAV